MIRWLLPLLLVPRLAFGQTEITQPFAQPDEYNRDALNTALQDLYDKLSSGLRKCFQRTPSDYVEHVVLFPARSQQSQTLGAGFPDIELYDTGTNKPKVTSMDFDATAVETMEFNWHPLHNIKRAGGFVFVDLHYSMTTAHAGTVRLKLEMWRANAGLDLAALGSANGSVTWTLNPSDSARIYDYNFYEVPYSGTIRGGEMGKIDLTSLGITSRQCEFLCRLTRVADDGTYDTHTGDLSVYRVEFHYQVDPVMETFGE